MIGLRKLLATGVVLLLESAAFVLMVVVSKSISDGLFIAYAGSVVAALAVYTGGNVISKKITSEVEVPKG